MRPARLLYFFPPRGRLKSRYGSRIVHCECQLSALTNANPQNLLSTSNRYSTSKSLRCKESAVICAKALILSLASRLFRLVKRTDSIGCSPRWLQKRRVRLTIVGTVEERILEILAEKRDIFRLYVDSAETDVPKELPSDALLRILRLHD